MAPRCLARAEILVVLTQRRIIRIIERLGILAGIVHRTTTISIRAILHDRRIDAAGRGAQVAS
jgi:hypothetical protein